MKNPVVHFEIQSQDPAALRAFYADLFDWNVQHHCIGMAASKIPD
jgi:predicted enzyme related to lactoylglutathione lyase